MSYRIFHIYGLDKMIKIKIIFAKPQNHKRKTTQFGDENFFELLFAVQIIACMYVDKKQNKLSATI